jgi:hypothetical protein
MAERQIGRVVSVDNFRVFIRLDEELTTTHKSGLNDIYEVARINSYVIIPVGADKVVALITRVKMQDETNFDLDSKSISLPLSSRYVTATMLGTIEGARGRCRFIQGVYNFPVLDNPVWYVITDDLDRIFDYKESEETSVNYATDYYLPIGLSPAFPDYEVKICPDQLFVKHGAVLGNTGSGKSCTLVSIIRSLIDFEFTVTQPRNAKKGVKRHLANAHIVIFDTNGEYKNALIAKGETFQRINAFHVDYTGLKVPYWFMNWDDFEYLFQPGPGTQAPILKRAIGLAKNEDDAMTKRYMPSFLIRGVKSIIDGSPESIKKLTGKSDFGNWKWRTDNEVITLATGLNQIKHDIAKAIGRKLEELGAEENFLNTDKQNSIIEDIRSLFGQYLEESRGDQISSDKNIDLPTWFNYQELITKFIDCAIEEQEASSSRMSEYLSTLRLRLESFLNDQRIAEPLMLRRHDDFDASLSKFLAFVLGDFYRFYKLKSEDPYSLFSTKAKPSRVSQVTILDMSLVPFDVLENLTGLIGRLIIEFVSHFEPPDRGKFPIVLVLEEAQNYIPERGRNDRESIAKRIFERIAREGRKYGVSLIVSSQRPSELSKTVLSQCNSFIVHRLQNPDDQKYIRGIVSSANSDILDQLPILPQQHAIVMGDCVRTPVQVKIADVEPKPNSDNPRFIESWLQQPGDFPDYEAICKKWKQGLK